MLWQISCACGRVLGTCHSKAAASVLFQIHPDGYRLTATSAEGRRRARQWVWSVDSVICAQTPEWLRTFLLSLTAHMFRRLLNALQSERMLRPCWLPLFPHQGYLRCLTKQVAQVVRKWNSDLAEVLIICLTTLMLRGKSLSLGGQ